MFKVCGIIGITKIVFFNFSGTERVNISVEKNMLSNKYYIGDGGDTISFTEYLESEPYGNDFVNHKL